MTTFDFSIRSLRALPLLLVIAGALPACGQGPVQGDALGEASSALSLAERKTRYGKIRDAATAGGILGKGYLLAGIAYDETGLAQCWSEATWACKGPSSSDCGNGPVIAGSADGPCADDQGGLGMFQFDAGTYSQTLSKYGNDVLTIDGQVTHAIAFVINIVKISNYTTNAETDAKAKAWINNFDINNATLRDEWIKTVVNYYNGCPPSGSCWSARYKSYNDALSQVLDDTNGTAFWGAAPDYKAVFSSQTFPLASAPFDLYPGQTKKGYIDLVNDGTVTWKPGEVFLGTTEPRDVKSPIAGPDWVAANRAATVDKDTPMGATGRFTFTVSAPEKAGDYPQYFNLVREGVAWFSDPGQGGPSDNQLEVKLTVKPSMCSAGLGMTATCDTNDVTTCDPATGKVTKVPCDGNCVTEASGAVCDKTMSEGGAGGEGGSEGSGTGGAASAGKSGAAGEGGKASGGAVGAAGKGGESAGAAGKSSGGQAGNGGASAGAGGGDAGAGGGTTTAVGGQGGDDGSVTLSDTPTSGEGGCEVSPTPSRFSTSGAVLMAGLMLLASRRKREDRRAE